VQKGLAPPRDTSLILFYVAKPVGEIAGYAEFVERKTGDSEELWKEYGRESVLNSREQFKQFIGDRPKASFIRFKNLHEAATPIPLKNILMLLAVKRLSRKGFYMNRKTAETLLAFME
jgi:predicted transcriptional regulator